MGGGDTDIKETEDEKMLARIGIEKFKEYQSLYPQVENEFFASVKSLNSDESYATGAGIAAANNASEFSDARQDAVARMAAGGINPSEGRFKQAIASGSSAESDSRLGNVEKTKQAIQDSYLAGRQNIVALGQGVEGRALTGIGDIAEASSDQARRSAVQGFNNRINATGDAAFAVGAAGNSIFGKTEQPDDPSKEKR